MPSRIRFSYRRLVAQKFDASRYRAYPGRPRVSAEVEALVVRFARENRSWGYDRSVGALANLGHPVSDQTVGNILRRHNIAPASERSRTTTWKEFIRSHVDVLAGTDFLTVEVLTWRGLVTYYEQERRPTRDIKKIPVFKNENDERKFWAIADSTEYVNWPSGKRRKLVRLKPPLKTITLRHPGFHDRGSQGAGKPPRRSVSVLAKVF